MRQKDAWEILLMGHNVFLTGSAGSGKTYLLNQYIEFLKKKKIPHGVTASTGIAATHLNGRTIHSWSGIGVKEILTETDLSKITHRRGLPETIRRAKVLIIDEISMLHSYRLDMVDQVCRKIRKIDSPFGGLQVILCGDFFQLPPVNKDSDRETNNFSFEANVWSEMDLKVCYLTEQHRQADQEFLEILNAIRSTKVNEKTVHLLESRRNKSVGVKNIIPTKLYTHNLDVDAINNFELSKIKEKPQVYQMQSSGIPELVETLRKNCLAPEILTVKKGAAVMFVKNNSDKGYVNGTLGTVIGFDKDSNYPLVKTAQGLEVIAGPESWQIEENDSVLAQISQVPLRLAWAITVHKSQGMSLDAAEIDLSKSFECGMGYVALSRVRSLSGIKLLGINEKAFEVNQEITELDKKLLNLSVYLEEALKQLGDKEKKRRQKEFLKWLKG